MSRSQTAYHYLRGRELSDETITNFGLGYSDKYSNNLCEKYNERSAMMKGLEFDAVVVVWDEARLSDGERRRLYTACSRALHSLILLGGETMIHDLGIVL